MNPNLRGKLIGITGSRGFIGSHLEKALVSLGASSFVFDCDLKNLDDARVLAKRCDLIYHLAGKNRGAPGEVFRNNVTATSNLILAFILEKNFPQVVFSSSSQVYWNSESEFARAKRIEEVMLMTLPSWCIFRIPNVYGPGCRPNYNSVVATFCSQVASGLPLTINDPADTREFIFIDDLIQKLINPAFNIIYKEGISAEKMSIGEVADLLTVRLGEHRKLAQTLESYLGRPN